MNNNSEYWNARVKKYGHTGWSDNFIYAFDQRARIMTIEKLLRSLSIGKALALDFGTGSGDFANLLSKYFEKVIAFDISDAVIQKAKKKYGYIKNIKFVAGNALEKVDLSCNSFDVILSVTVLDHIMDDLELTRTLNAFKLLLNETGIIIAFEYALDSKKSPSSYQRLMQFSDWQAILSSCGFALYKTYGFYHPREDPSASYLAYKSHLNGLKGKFLRILDKMKHEWVNKYLNNLANKYLMEADDTFYENSHNSSPLKIMIYKKLKEQL